MLTLAVTSHHRQLGGSSLEGAPCCHENAVAVELHVGGVKGQDLAGIKAAFLQFPIDDVR